MHKATEFKTNMKDLPEDCVCDFLWTSFLLCGGHPPKYIKMTTK